MAGRSLSRELDRDFVTIYFLQEDKANRRLAIRRVSLVLGIILVLFLVVFLKVWQQMQVVKLGYQINQHRAAYHQLLDEHRVLTIRRNALASLERIEAIAREKLSLDTPKGEQLIFLVDPAARVEGLSGWLDWMPGLGRWWKDILL